MNLKKIDKLLVIFLCIAIFPFILTNRNLNQSERSQKQAKLLIKKVQNTLRKRHNLHLIMTGGCATSNRGVNLCKCFSFRFWGTLSQHEVKKKFLLGLLEVLYLINTTKNLQEHLVVRPFTLHNLEFTIWSQVDRSDLEPKLLRLYIIRSDLGEITLKYKDLHYKPLQKKLHFADIYTEYQNEIPDYLKKTAQQILDCPFVEKQELDKRYHYLWLNDESL